MSVKLGNSDCDYLTPRSIHGRGLKSRLLARRERSYTEFFTINYRNAQTVGIFIHWLEIVRNDATSVGAYYFSEVALSYALEGGIATTVAYSAWKSIKTGKWQWLLFCTIIFALGGSVRQTTLAFLLPLWVYAVWSSRTGFRPFVAYFAVLMVVVSAWMYPNAHFIAKYWEKGERGYLSSVYNLQIVMQQWYDTTKVMEKSEYTEKVEKFHWPVVEIVVASKNYFFPPADSAPIEIRQASNINALKVILYQFCKLLFYLTFALGLATFPLLLVFAGRQYSSSLGRQKAEFLGFWLIPALLFFIFGHFGSWGYLLLLMGGPSLIASNCIVDLHLTARSIRQCPEPRYVVLNRVGCDNCNFYQEMRLFETEFPALIPDDIATLPGRGALPASTESTISEAAIANPNIQPKTSKTKRSPNICVATINTGTLAAKNATRPRENGTIGLSRRATLMTSCRK